LNVTNDALSPSLSLFLSIYNPLFIFQEQFRMIDLVPASTLTTMLVSSLAFLVITQLPSAMTSKRSRILIGLTSSIVLGLGILILGNVLALFACILSIIAVLPKMRWRVPLVLGSILAFAHVSRRLILDDPSGYYDVIQVNASGSYQERDDKRRDLFYHHCALLLQIVFFIRQKAQLVNSLHPHEDNKSDIDLWFIYLQSRD